MSRHLNKSLIVVASSVPISAVAGDAGPEFGVGLIVIYYFICYLVSCLFSIPLSLLLPGSRLKRITAGLVVPIIGTGFGALTDWLQYKGYTYYVNNDQEMVFIIVSSIPIVFLLIWVIVSRARTAAFERSRVQYAEYLKTRNR